MFGYLVATLLVVSGLVLVGYSFLIRDPFASAAVLAQQPPSNSTMTLTVPEMRRVDRVPVYTGAVNDKGALHDGTLHLNSTGYPWQTGANVYIAGHRLGFPGTRSYLVFWDLNTLEDGDKIILTDANGTRYTYSVFKSTIINPERLLRHTTRTRQERHHPADVHPPRLRAAPDRTGRVDSRG